MIVPEKYLFLMKTWDFNERIRKNLSLISIFTNWLVEEGSFLKFSLMSIFLSVAITTNDECIAESVIIY